MSSYGNQLGKRANQLQKLILNKETFLNRERLSGMKEVCRALQETESHPHEGWCQDETPDYPSFPGAEVRKRREESSGGMSSMVA